MPSDKTISLRDFTVFFDESYNNKIAFIDHTKHEEISYSEVFKDICRQSHNINLDVKESNQKILVFLDSGYPFVITLYSLLFSGHIPILVNIKLKGELSQLYDNYNYIITDKSHESHLKQYLKHSDHQIIYWENGNKQQSDTKYPFKMHRDITETMLYLYTSGSTGQAKMLPKTYENILIEAGYLTKLLDLTENDTILPLVPSFHIYGLLFTIILPFLVGCKIRKDIPFSPLNILEDGILKGSTLVIGNPSLYSGLSSIINQFKDEDFNHVKWLISSTMPLPEDLAIDFYSKVKIKTLELYGSTETGGIAFRKIFEDKYWTFFPYIQHNMELENQSLKINSPGLSISEFPKLQDNKWFDTGDVVAQGPSKDRFSLLGRENQIVKIAGNRVSAIEVQNVINESPYILMSAVIGVSAKNLAGEQLVAYIQIKENIDDSIINHIKSFCKKRLAEYKIPKHFIVVDEIPLGPNNKIIYHKLPKL
ncbi:MAG: acyl--CoA ligase [Spirochaetota bacterium]|nr:acyl--CoA ligase [Spirochaetota bacterium]